LKEKKNKPSLVITGSIDVKDRVEENTTTKNEERKPSIVDKVERLSDFDAMQVSDIMEQILSLTQIEKDLESLPAEPGYILSSDKPGVWLYSVSRRTFFEVKSGSEILSIEKIDENKSHCLINSDVFEVDNDMITCVGWN